MYNQAEYDILISLHQEVNGMLNKFCKKPLYEVTQTMAKVAMGVEKRNWSSKTPSW